MPIHTNSTYSLHNWMVHRAVLSNGLTVLTVENPAADIVSARLFVRVGRLYESPEQSGISHLLTAVLTKGTQRLSSQAIAERVESVGANLGADAATDYSVLSLKTVATDFENILGLSAEILRSPSFPTPEVELERRLVLQGIRSMQEQPFPIAQKHLQQAMYQTHPYAVSSLGKAETVAGLQAQDLALHHATYFRPDNVVVSIAGRIEPTKAIALVDQYFGDWQVPTQADGNPICLLLRSRPRVIAQPQQVLTSQESHQAIVMLGYLAASVKDSDYAALKLLSTYLGSGLSSRLFVELREKRGLAYEVSGFYPTRLDPSQFVVYIGTAPENTAIALAGLQQEVERLSKVLLEPDEIQSTKNKLLGQYALGKQTNTQIAHILGWYETLGLGIEFDQQFQQQVSMVSADQAQQVAQAYFNAPYISIVGPQTL